MTARKSKQTPYVSKNQRAATQPATAAAQPATEKTLKEKFSRVHLIALVLTLSLGFASGAIITQKNMESARETYEPTQAYATFEGDVDALLPDIKTQHSYMDDAPDITYDNAGELRWKSGTDDPDGIIVIDVYYPVVNESRYELSEPYDPLGLTDDSYYELSGPDTSTDYIDDSGDSHFREPYSPEKQVRQTTPSKTGNYDMSDLLKSVREDKKFAGGNITVNVHLEAKAKK